MEENNSTFLKPSTLTSTNNNYAVNRKIMLCFVIILFAAVSIMICTRSYARCLFRRSRRRRRRVASHRLASLSATSASSGLDLSVLKTLPTFVYVSDREGKGDDARSSLECSVCLSEFEDKEEGRVLPKCKHTFHLECVDMWFGSHSTCPLCRAPIEPLDGSSGDDSNSNATEVSGEMTVTVMERVGSEPGKCDKEESETRGFDFSISSPSGSHEPESLDLEKKPVDVVRVIVEVPMEEMD